MQAPTDISYGVINWAKPDTATPAQFVVFKYVTNMAAEKGKIRGNVGRNWFDL